MKKYENIYFIGIGGIGMSAIARYCRFKGYNVSGYDRTPSELTEELEKVNTDKEPVDLEGSVSVSQDGRFSGTIDHWEVVSVGDVEAK